MAVIGWILLGILIFLLCVLLLILFFPVSYQLKAAKTPDKLTAGVKIKWLFGFVRVLFDYPEPAKPVIKIAFFTLGKKKHSDETSSEHSQSQETHTHEALPVEPQNDEMPHEEARSDETIPDEVLSDETITEDSRSEETPSEDSRSEEPLSDESQSDERISEASHSDGEQAEDDQIVDTSAQNLQADKEQTSDLKSHDDKKSAVDQKKKTDWLSDKKKLLDKIKRNYEFYKKLWQEEDTKPLLKSIFGRLFHIFKHVIPRKIRGKLIFGAATPDVTGYVYGGYCVFSSLFPKRVTLEFVPDFENSILECDVLIKGQVILFILLIDGLRVFFNKNLRRKIKKIQHFRKTQK